AGLDHRTHALTESLSGGQKQLLAIAGAAALNAAVLIFDEATSMLDQSSRDRVLHMVRQLHEQGTTIIWITQQVDELAYAASVIVLEQGAIAFDGDGKAFFYESMEQEKGSYCESFGFVPPFAVQAVQQLHKRGLVIPDRPITPEQLNA